MTSENCTRTGTTGTSTSYTSTTAEEIFLHSRQQRLEERLLKQKEDEKKLRYNDIIIQQFWKEVKVWISNWNILLQTIANQYNFEVTESISLSSGYDVTEKNNNVSVPITTTISENDKRIIKIKLTQLLYDLKLFRKQCLMIDGTASTSASSTTTTVPPPLFVEEKHPELHQQEQQLNGTHIITSIPNNTLQETDIRLLYKEFTKCQLSFDTVWNNLLPKGKFVFKRYRTAMEQHNNNKQKQEQNMILSLDNKNDKILKDDTIKKKVEEECSTNNNEQCDIDNNNGIIYNFNDATIHVMVGKYDTNETIIRNNNNNKQQQQAISKIQSMDENNNDTIISPKKSIVIPISTETSSLLLRNIDTCTVLFSNGSNQEETFGSNSICQSVHIESIQNSTIFINFSIQGAIHISNCQNCTILLMEAHQLRIHTSFNIKFIIINCISSGIILEECTKIIFSISEQPHDNSLTNTTTTTTTTTLIKDFEWLRNNVASPNYTIVDQYEHQENINNLYKQFSTFNIVSKVIKEDDNQKQQQQQQGAVDSSNRSTQQLAENTTTTMKPQTKTDTEASNDTSAVDNPNTSQDNDDEEDDDEL